MENLKNIIVTLGGGVAQSGALLTSSKLNVEKTVELFRKNPGSTIIMTGKHSFGLKPSKTEAQAMKEYAVLLGVPSNSILIEEKAMDTVGNAYFTNKLISSMENVRSITVIAINLHMKRVQLIFEKMFRNRFALYFVNSGIPKLSSKELRAIEQAEKEKISLFFDVYGAVMLGDSVEFSQMIEKSHILYTKNRNTVPEIVWKEFERRGYNRADLE